MSQQELAQKAEVSLGTIKRIESAETEMIGNAQTLLRIKLALESEGVVFIDQDGKQGPGVRLKKPLLSSR